MLQVVLGDSLLKMFGHPTTPILDVALLLSLVANCIQGADFLVRPAQKQRIEDFAETATLHLEEFRPIKYLKLLATRRGQKVLFLLAVCGTQWYGIIRSPNNAVIRNSDHLIGMILSAVIALLSLPMFIYVGPSLVNWLYADGRMFRFMMRWIGLCIASFVILLLWVVSLIATVHKTYGSLVPPDPFFHHLVHLSMSKGEITIFCLLYLFFVVFGVVVMAAHAGAVILVMSIGTLLLELILKFLRAFAWRIVEYNKGAFPALMLVLTGVLGVLKLYLGHK